MLLRVFRMLPQIIFLDEEQKINLFIKKLFLLNLV